MKLATAISSVVVAALALLAPPAVDALGGQPSRDDYDYDGETTYCYLVGQGLSVVSLDYSYVIKQGKRQECPVTISLSQITTGKILPLQNVQYKFVAKLNLGDNAFDFHALQATVPDPTTGAAVQIGHANIHTCARATVCDVFRNGAGRKITDQETSNFTDNMATFTQQLAYDVDGDYNVFAHIVLPPKNPKNESLHFITFVSTTVQSVNGAKNGNGDSGGSSTTVIIAVVASVVVVIGLIVGVVFFRRKRANPPLGHDQFRNSTYAPTHTTKNSRLDWNGDPDYQFGHDRYQSSMASEYRQPPGLSASALAFQDNRSVSKQKTVSSSGSYDRQSSPKQDPYRYGNQSGFGAIQLPEHHGVDTYNTYYNNGYDAHGPSPMESYRTDGSVGTAGNFPPSRSAGYNSNGHRAFEHGASGFAYTHPRINTGQSLEELSEIGRDSEASLGTVDFGVVPHLPSPKAQEKYRETSDSLASADFVPDFARSQRSGDFASTERTLDFGDTSRTYDFRETGESSNYLDSYRTDSSVPPFPPHGGFRGTENSQVTDSFRGTDEYGSDSYRGTDDYRSTDNSLPDAPHRPKRSESAEMYEF